MPEKPVLSATPSYATAQPEENIKNETLKENSKKNPWQVYADILAEKKNRHLYRTTTEISSAQSAHVTCDGKELLMLASNDYLGLIDHPDVIAAALRQKNIYISAIRYPTVAKNHAMLRAALMATHTVDELRHAAKTIAATIKELK